MNITKKISAIALLIVSCLTATAQTPYSMYGYGILNDNATSSQRAMGGVGYAMQSGRQINVMNPASYAAIDSLTFLFDMGLTASAMWSKENGASGKDFGGGLDYITMQFPITRYLGASIGLLPYSSVGYSFGSKMDNGADSRSGSGGLNQLYVGIGGRPFKGFTVGANIGYLFGTTINDIYAVPEAANTALFERVVQVRDYHLQFGVQYSLDINRDNKLTAGVTYSPSKSLLGHAWRVNYYNIGSSDVHADTVAYTSLRDKYTLPDTWGFGLNYQWRERLMVEADVTYQNWKDVKYAELDRENGMMEFNNRLRLGLGAQYTPYHRGNYAQRISYRIGGYYSNDYIKIGTNDVKEYGVSLGFGLPAPGSKTVVNIGLEWKHRQGTPNALIKEDYLNITLGINVNELWFFQSKIR